MNLVEIVQSESKVLNLVCSNLACIGKLSNRIDHYCGKKGLDIKGLSIKTIEKLIDWGWINGIKDIYKLYEHESSWISKEGFGRASVKRIIDSIEASKREVLLSSFISGLGIPLVGRGVAKEITKYYPTWDDFRAAIGGDWTELDGFGPEINWSLNNFDYTEADEIAAMLDFAPLEVQDRIVATSATFCITGKLQQFKNRNELKDYIESIGGRVVGSMSSKVDILINNDDTSNSAKNKAAKEKGIPIMTEAKFIETYGQNK
jgi:DNA ligase (NAD+)